MGRGECFPPPLDRWLSRECVMLSDYVDMSLIQSDRKYPHWFGLDCLRSGWVDELRRKGLTEEEAEEMLREEID